MLPSAISAIRPACFTYIGVSEYTTAYERARCPDASEAVRRVRPRRARAIEAAGRVFVERGFAGSSVEAIATEAGFTRGAFYSNFNSRRSCSPSCSSSGCTASTRSWPGRTPTPPAPARARPASGWRLSRARTGAGSFASGSAARAHGPRRRVPQDRRRLLERNRALAARDHRLRGGRYHAAGCSRPTGERLDRHRHEAWRCSTSWIPTVAPLELYPELCELLFGPLVPRSESAQVSEPSQRDPRTWQLHARPLGCSFHAKQEESRSKVRMTTALYGVGATWDQEDGRSLSVNRAGGVGWRSPDAALASTHAQATRAS